MNITENLKNVVASQFPISALHVEEVDLLLSVANRFAERYPACTRHELKGSFCLVGQKDGEYPEEILRFDFPGGRYENHSVGTDSRALVAIGIDQALKNDTANIYTPSDKLTANTLTLKTKYGRFVLSVFLTPRNIMRDFLLHMACAIKEIGYANPMDKTLAFSFDGIHIHRDERPEISRLEAEIWGNTFSTPEMDAWRIWHNGHERTKGGPTGFFFEDPSETINQPVLLRA